MIDDASRIPIERVEQSIHLIRGHKVMLDRDLAGLYGVETRALNQAVKRKIARFPEDFMFELAREEVMRISQIVISSDGSDLKDSKKVFAFTEPKKNPIGFHVNEEPGIYSVRNIS
jgi:hypothetical protein